MRFLILIFILFIQTTAFAADMKLTSLPSTTPSFSDMTYIVTDPTGSPTSSKITLRDFVIASSISLIDLLDVGTTAYTAGNILVANGASFVSVAVGGDLTLAGDGSAQIASGVVGPTEIASTAVTAGTYLGSNVTVDADGRITNASRGSLTSLSDVNTATITAGRILIADGTDFESVAVSGDISLGSDGAVAVQANSVALGTDTTGGYAASTTEGGGATSLEADAVDALTEIAQGIKTAADDTSKLVVGTAGSTNDCAKWDSTGALVTAGAACGTSSLNATGVAAGTYLAANITVSTDGRLSNAARGSLTSLSDVSDATKTAGNLLVADGTNFKSVALSNDCTLASDGAITCSAGGLTATGVAAGTYLAANVTVGTDGRLTNAQRGSLTSLSDVNTATITAGRILVADGTDYESVGVSGDASLGSDGNLQLGSNTVGASELASTAVSANTYLAANVTVDADGRITNAARGSLTSLSDVSDATKTAGNLLIANGTNFVSTQVTKPIAQFTISNGNTAIDATVTDPVACTRIARNSVITAWYITCDQSGSIVVDVWKNTWDDTPETNSDSIASTEKPTLSSDVSASDTSLGAMTTTWSSTDNVCIEIESASTVTKCSLQFVGYNN